MFISVIMSVYNAEKHLESAIESILQQTYKNFEFLIVDDCSTDRSFQILQKYKKKYPKISIYRNQVNCGLTSSLNTLLKKTNGELIARMDSDDISKKNRFEKQVTLFKADKDMDIVGTLAEDIDNNLKVIRKRRVPIHDMDIKKMLPLNNPFIHPSVMMRKSVFQKIGYYNEKLRTSQDYDLWFRAAAAGLKFANVPKYLLQYRFDKNYMNKKSLQYRLIECKIRIRGYKRIKLPLYKWGYLFIPIILGIIPYNIFNLLKKLDPRNKF